MQVEIPEEVGLTEGDERQVQAQAQHDEDPEEWLAKEGAQLELGR